ncbi:MAG: type II toxin-antitoxin system HicA family toxin [Nitrospinae bacterium]|nr:type II toxin-antitoxin system HicA family toxin [Nitrospinota bacterium]
MTKRKLLLKILNNQRNVRFKELSQLAMAFGFILVRIKGSHHIFAHPAVNELVNLQDVDGSAKPYQVRQFLKLAEKYNLRLEEKEA